MVLEQTVLCQKKIKRDGASKARIFYFSFNKNVGKKSARLRRKKSNNLIGCLNGLAGPMGAVTKDE